jgi:hypothetical protein
MNEVEFVENDEGVHVMRAEFTLCGDAFDAPETELDWEAGPFRKTRRRAVTCLRCADIVRLCRGVRVSKDPSHD